MLHRPRYKRIGQPDNPNGKTRAGKLPSHPKTMTGFEAVERGLIKPNPNSDLARMIEEAMVRNQNRPLTPEAGSDVDKTPPSALGDAFDVNGRTL